MGAFPSAMPCATRVDTAAAPGGFSSLPREVLSTHVVRFLHEPADLGRLRAVSKDMRDAVDATGRKIKKLSNGEAAHLGYVSLLKDRHRRGVLLDRYKLLLCAAAARNGDLEELKALRADKWPWDTRTCLFAARGGQLETLKWARANGCPWGVGTCECAAQGGHLEVLKWARENGCPWDAEETCALAVQGGHLEVLKWARANGCPWSELTCTNAAKHGHLETLKWARANGCPWDESTCRLAAEGGHRGAEVGARERLSVGRVYAPSRGFEGIRRNKDSLRSLGFRVGAMTYGISENFMLSK